jgi:hypothetical protein
MIFSIPILFALMRAARRRCLSYGWQSSLNPACLPERGTRAPLSILRALKPYWGESSLGRAATIRPEASSGGTLPFIR